MRKTILAVAVATAAMTASVGAYAQTQLIDFDFVQKEGTTKLIGGYDEEMGSTNELDIQTSADAQKMLHEVKAALSEKDFSKLMAAISQVNAQNKTAILTGTTGGATFLDEKTEATLKSLTSLLGVLETMGKIDPEVVDKVTSLVQKIQDQTITAGNSITLEGGTHINIGREDGSSEPVLLATVGGDRVLNADFKFSSSDAGPDGATVEVIRKGNVQVDAHSGNLFLLTGGSSAVNVAGLQAEKSIFKYGALAKETSATIDGNVGINLDGHVNAAGVLAAGSALALGGTANSTVTGNVLLTVNTSHDSNNIVSGVVAGIVGGGSAIGTLGGTANTSVGGTTVIDLQQGTIGGVLGGGLAAAADFTDVSNLVDELLKNVGGKDLSDNVNFNEELLKQTGTATATSGNVLIKVGSNASAAGVFGGGAAFAYQYGDSTKGAHATAKVGSVGIIIGEEGGKNPFLDESGQPDNEAKGKFFLGLKQSLHGFADGDLSMADLTNFLNVANQPGLTAFVSGGGLAAAWDRNRGQNNTDSAESYASVTSTVENVDMTVLSGYNVGLVGGGVALASGRGDQNGTPMATADVLGDVSMTFAGGESIGVLGGGVAVFAGSKEENTGVGAQANVGNSTITVINGASVDGIFGGGLSADDTNPVENGQPVLTTNVNAHVNNVKIQVADATVNTLNFKAFAQIDHDKDAGQKDLLGYAYSAFEAASDQKVALMGGGIAAGLNEKDVAGTSVDNTTILLGEGAVVNGNVFGGGMAVAGGNSYVDNANITVSGAKVDGSIYGGGLAVGQVYLDHNAGSDYANSRANVNKVQIGLVAGELTGNVYAAGLNDVKDGQYGSGSVKDAEISIWNGFKLGGDIVGTGAENATLTFVNGVDLTKADDTLTQVTSFDKIVAVGGDVNGFNYDSTGKSLTVEGDGAVTISKLTNLTGTLAVGSNDKVGFVGMLDMSDLTNTGTLSVDNGVLTLGGSGRLGLDAYDGHNAIYITGQVDVSNLKVTANSTTIDSGLYVGEGGELIANAAGNTTLKGNASLEEGASLRFDHVGVDLADGQTEQIVTFENGLTDVPVTWDNVLWTVSTNETGTTYTFRAENAIGLDDDVYGFYNGLGSDDPLRDRLDSGNYRGEESLKAGMNLAAAAGVQAAAIEGMNIGIDTANRRASLTRTYRDGVEGFAELSGVYSKMGGNDDMNEVKLEMGGVVVGADYSLGDWTFGGLLNAGTGTVRGQGDNGGVKNEVDYYGFQLYGAKRFGNFNAVTQMGYVATSNDLSDRFGAVSVGDLDADVWTIGVRGEMSVATSERTRLIPYIGLNYLRVSTDGYTTNQGTSVDSADQNLFTLPVGAVFQGTFATASGWAWTPSVDVAYVGAFGDRDVEVDTTSLTGNVGSVAMDVWTESTFRMRVGLEATKGNFGLGVTAGGSVGTDDSSGVFGMIRARYAF